MVAAPPTTAIAAADVASDRPSAVYRAAMPQEEISSPARGAAKSAYLMVRRKGTRRKPPTAPYRASNSRSHAYSLRNVSTGPAIGAVHVQKARRSELDRRGIRQVDRHGRNGGGDQDQGEIVAGEPWPGSGERHDGGGAAHDGHRRRRRGQRQAQHGVQGCDAPRRDQQPRQGRREERVLDGAAKGHEEVAAHGAVQGEQQQEPRILPEKRQHGTGDRFRMARQLTLRRSLNPPAAPAGRPPDRSRTDPRASSEPPPSPRGGTRLRTAPPRRPPDPACRTVARTTPTGPDRPRRAARSTP